MGSACRQWSRNISETKFAWKKKQFHPESPNDQMKQTTSGQMDFLGATKQQGPVRRPQRESDDSYQIPLCAKTIHPTYSSWILKTFLGWIVSFILVWRCHLRSENFSHVTNIKRKKRVRFWSPVLAILKTVLFSPSTGFKCYPSGARYKVLD